MKCENYKQRAFILWIKLFATQTSNPQIVQISDIPQTDLFILLKLNTSKIKLMSYIICSKYKIYKKFWPLEQKIKGNSFILIKQSRTLCFVSCISLFGIYKPTKIKWFEKPIIIYFLVHISCCLKQLEQKCTMWNFDSRVLTR